MKTLILGFVFSAISMAGFAQGVTKDDASKLLTEIDKLKEQETDTAKAWKFGGLLSLNGQQVALTNWSAGGNSSISVGSLANFFAKYKKGKSFWDNNLDVAYGVIKQGTNKTWWKNDDRIQLNSKYGYKAFDHVFYAVLADFKTQFTDGYNYPNDSVYISRFMAPAYGLVALGLDYKPNDHFSLFVSPVTGKFTFVNDPNLARAGAFGVQKEISYYDSTKNELVVTQKYLTHREEFGAYLKMQYKTKVMDNITFETVLELFSNYLDHPENIDVNWTTLTNFKVNSLVSATLSTNLIYDDDINLLRTAGDNKGTVGPDIQFKQVLAIGLTYKLNGKKK